MQRKAHPLAVLLVLLYAAVMLAPIAWMVKVSFTDPVDTASRTPGIVPQFSESKPAAWHFRFTTANYKEFFGLAPADADDNQLQQAKDTRREFLLYLRNSTVVSVVATLLSVFLGAFAAYGFSRFKIAGSKDWQFFILSTRMLPALAVSVPISWMYYRIDAALGVNLLRGTPIGLIILYTCFNLSFSTWMMKAFIDEIPTAYEEAALLDGYTRARVLCKIILPQAGTGLMATAVFCLIASWNEYAFALSLTQPDSQTLPVYLARVFDQPGTPYGRLAAGSVMFMLPIVVFSLLMRKHLLRGITFGAVKG